MLIDTHAHLWWDSYEKDLPEVIARARLAGVEKMIVPGTDIESSRKAIELAKKYPGVIYASVGVHPEEITQNTLKVRPSHSQRSDLGLQTLITGSREQIVAVGEIGTDKFNKPTQQQTNEQLELFRQQCMMALEFELPIIVHTRESLDMALSVLDELPSMPRGQFHCFSHDEEGMKQVLSRGFCVSFCGNIMYSKRVAKLVYLVPDDKLLLETDSPFMQPGESNEPAYVKVLAEKIAELRGQSVEQIEEMTTVNANRLYKL